VFPNTAKLIGKFTEMAVTTLEINTAVGGEMVVLYAEQMSVYTPLQGKLKLQVVPLPIGLIIGIQVPLPEVVHEYAVAAATVLPKVATAVEPLAE
jgi:hypothetical protein